MSLFLGLLASFSSLAQKVTIKTQLSPMGAFDITGSSLSGYVSPKENTFVGQDITLDLKNLKSGMELRDKHIQEYFETKKFPSARLLQVIGKNSKFSGDLEVRNIKKRITGTYKIRKNKVEANFKVKMSDFSIKKAIYMGIGVEDEVEVVAEVPIKKAEAMKKAAL